MGGAETLQATFDLFFFGFDRRLDGYAKRSGQKVGADTLEPVISRRLRAAKDITPGALHRRHRCGQRRAAQARAPSTPSTTSGCRRRPRASPSRGVATTSRSPALIWSTMIEDLFEIRRASTRSRTTSWVRRPCPAARHAFDGRADRRTDCGQAGRRASAAAAGECARGSHAVEGPSAAAARIEDVRQDHAGSL